MDEVPILEGLTNGWVNDNVGLFFLLEQVAECGNITWLGAACQWLEGDGRGCGRR